MKKTLKCALVLTLVVLALFAITMLGASAATHASDADAIAAGNVVKVEYTKSGAATTEYYATVTAAVTGMGTDIANGATITVLGDIAADGAATISSGTVTINGNGYTATGLALTISGGSVTIDGLNIINTTAGKNAIGIDGDADVVISNATIQGANAAIWVFVQVKTPIQITNCTIKAVVQSASTDYGFAFYTASNAGFVATNVDFALEFASGVSGCKGKGVFRNDGRCPREGNTDFSWTFGNCTISSALTSEPYFATNKDLHIFTGEGGLTITRADATADIFKVPTAVTLKLSGIAPTETSGAVYLTIKHTASAYISPINLQGTAKLILDYVDVYGADRAIYSNGNSTITATNSKLSSGSAKGHNGIVYYEGTVTAAKATFTDCELTAAGFAFECASANIGATLNFTDTTITYSGSQMFRFNGTGSSITLNGGVFNGAAGGLILTHANTTFTMNNVTHNAGTYGALQTRAAGCVVTINGGSHTCSESTPLVQLRSAGTVNIYGGYFTCVNDIMFEVGGAAELNIYGGYFHRTAYETEAATFVQAGSASYGAGTVNVFGGTFVADYTDAGSVFSIYDASSTLNAAAYNGMGSAVLTLNMGDIVTEQEASFSFSINSIKVFNTISLRLGATVNESGLRFTSYVSKGFLDMVNTQKDTDTSVSYGTVVIPVKYLEGVTYFTAETVAKALVIPATAAGMRDDEANGGMFIRASIYNLPHISKSEGTDMTYYDEYAVTVYAEYIKDGKTVRQYATYSSDAHNAAPADLANDALQDTSKTETGAYVYPVVSGDNSIVYSRYSDAEREIIGAFVANYDDYIDQNFEVNGQYYETLNAALTAADDGDTITLLQDVALNSAVTISKNVTINGGNFTLTLPASANAHFFTIEDGVSLTVTDLNAVNEGTNTYANAMFKPTGAATLTVNGGSYSAAGVVLYGESCADSVVTLNDTTFETRTGTQAQAAPILVNADMSLTINGGTYTTTSKTSTGNALRILNTSAIVTVTAGTFDANGGDNAIYTANSINLSLADGVVINGGIEAIIADQACQNRTDLVNVVVPAYTTSIGNNAFYGCINLETIVLPDTLTSIGNECFMNCTSLKSITLPSSLTAWGTSSFYNCSSLAEVTFADGFAYNALPAYTFKNCAALDGIVLPDCIAAIGMHAFYGCASLSAIVIPNAVTSIGAKAFASCTALTEMTVPFVGATLGGTSNTHFGYFFGASSYTANATTVPSTLVKVTITKQCAFAATDFLDVEAELVYSHIWKNEWESDAINHWHVCSRSGCTATSSITAHTYNSNNVCTTCSYEYEAAELTFTFDSTTSTYTVTGYSGAPIDVIIPALYNGYPVTGIAASAFQSCTTLSSLSVGENVTTIGANAFTGCTSLKTVVLSEGLESIGKECFHKCTKLQSINIPASVTTMGESVFHTCSSLREVTFAASGNLTAIPNYLFRKCTSLSTVALPEGVTSIGYVALADCTALVTVSIPSTVETIDAEAFNNSTSIRSIAMPTTWIATIRDYFTEGVVIKSVTINGGTTIDASAFSTYTDLQSVTIGGSVTTIGSKAFYGCANLSTVVLSEGLLTIDSMAFRDCMLIKEIVIPTTVTKINSHAFRNCYALENVTLSTSLATLGAYAFTYTAISEISLPSSLKAMGAGVFEHCHNLTSIKLPTSITSIPERAFRYCQSLTSVTFTSYAKLTTIGANAFAYCTALESFRFPTSVTTVGKGAFYWCRSLDKVITTNLINWSKINFENSDANPLSNGGKLYSNSTATNLVTTVSVSSTVTAIGSYAFYNCDTLTSITFTSAKLASIGKGAFGSCDALTAVNAATVAVWCGITFENATANPLNGDAAKLYVKNGTAYEQVTTLEMPSTVTEVSAWAFYGCDQLTGVNVTDLGAWSAINFGNFYGNPLYYAKNLSLNGAAITELSIPETVTAVGDHAFVNGAFTSVIVPASVTHVGANAFNNCTATTITAAPITLSYSSFDYCNAWKSATVSTTLVRYLPKNQLTSVVISGGTSIPDEAFKDYTTLQSITISPSVTHIGVNAFEGCTALKNVYITDMTAWCAIDFDNAYANPLHVASNLYLNGSKVTEVSIPEGATTIAPFAFYGFKGITAVTIPASVTMIDSYAFANCTALASVTFSGDGLADIQSYAFSGCTALTTIAIPSTLTSIAPYAFSGAGLTSVTGSTSGFKRYTSVSASWGISTTLNANNLKTAYAKSWWKR